MNNLPLNSPLSEMSLKELFCTREVIDSGITVQSISTDVHRQVQGLYDEISYKLPPISLSDMKRQDYIYRGTLIRRLAGIYRGDNVFECTDFPDAYDEGWIDFTRPGYPDEAFHYALFGHGSDLSVHERTDPVILEIPWNAIKEDFSSLFQFEHERPTDVSLPIAFLIGKQGKLYRPVP